MTRKLPGMESNLNQHIQHERSTDCGNPYRDGGIVCEDTHFAQKVRPVVARPVTPKEW